MSSEPQKPVLFFDGDCSFCRMWVDFWHNLTGDEVVYLPYSDGRRDAVEFVEDGAHYWAAQAVFRLLSRVAGYGWMFWAYRYIPGFAWVSERIYSLIPARRNLAYWITRILWGTHVETPSYRLAAVLFARALAIVYLIAFVSFGLQVDGLIGSHGILPLRAFLGAVSGWGHPTIFWWASSDADLRAACWMGASLAIAAALLRSHSAIQRTAFALMFVLYLSIVTAGQVFMGYQWDYLLLEAGFLAIFLVPTFPRILVFQWLLFRLMFESGLVKLQSHDATWSSLTALTYHYETQPLPTPLAWYAAQLPPWFQKTSVVFVLGVELVLPLLMFGPRRLKQAAAAGTVLLQILIVLTGNYTFFNWLTIALCLFLLDDRFFGRVPGALSPQLAPRRANLYLSTALAVFVVVIGCTQITEMCGNAPPSAMRKVNSWLSPFGLVNEYGLFASMTTTRPEISIEGSNDGATWLSYEFRYKAGPLDRAPAWVAPYQPRLDWQMWFAALGSYPQSPWFGQFMLQLLRGSPPVLRLLARDPFAGKPPKYIRAQLYEYRFTREHSRDWWRRESAGAFFPTVSLRQR